jgi:hypothetical protein
MEKRTFLKHEMYVYDSNNKIINVNPNAIEFAEEAFILFKSLYNTGFGSITEDDNLISIHTGGWSDNESLISDFKLTGWWFKYHKISVKGGHYYFNTNIHADNNWQVLKTPPPHPIIDAIIEDLQENAMPFKTYVYEPKTTHQIIAKHLKTLNYEQK